MIIKIIKGLIFLLTLHFALLTLHLDKAAAAGLSLGVYPPIIQIEVDAPPANIKTPIAIQNEGEETVKLKIEFKPFTASSKENGEVEYLGSTEGLPALYQNGTGPGADPFIFKKMQILEGEHIINTVKLAPQQTKTLTLHLGIPKDEPISDYYFSITFTAVNDTELETETNASYSTGGISTNVLLTIGPKGKASGLIEEFSAPQFLEKGPVPFTVRIKNTGSHVIAPQGQILIRNMFGQTVGKVDLLPVNILANTIRAVPDASQSPDATPSSNFQFSIFNFQFSKAFWPESFLLGLYTATLTIALTNEGPLFSRTIQFYAVPTQVVIGLIVAILLILIVREKVKKKLS